MGCGCVGCGVLSTGCGVRGVEYGVLSTGCGVRGADVWGAGC